MGPTYKCSNKKKIDDMTLIWLDKTISRTDENYYSMTQLGYLVHSICTFTRGDRFIEYLNTVINEPIILVVSGSLGYQIIPKIHSSHLIDSIYIFCQNKIQHRLWANNFSKIKGVFNEIDLLCLYLRKRKLFQPKNTIKNESSLDKSSPLTFIEHLDQSDSENEHVKDEFMSYYTECNALPASDTTIRDCCEDKTNNIDSCLMYFSSDDNLGRIDLENSVQHSNTVIPFVPESNQQYLDNGSWPSLWWIIKNEDNFSKMIALNNIRHLIFNIKIVENVDRYLKFLNNDSNEKHFIVICDSDNLEEYIPLICRQEHVHRVYLHSSLHSLEKYKSIIKRYSTIISILHQSDNLVHMILQDYVYYSIELAEYYRREKKKNLAKIQYEYALLLQSNIQNSIKEKSKSFDKH